MAARGSAVTHVSAIMRVRKDELISIFAGCLSPAAGRGDTGPLALPLTVGLRWYGRAGGTLEDGDVGQQPAHHAIWIREKPDGAPPATTCSAWPDRTPAARHPRTVPSRVPQSVRDSGQAIRVRTHPSARGAYLVLLVNGCRRSHRSRPDLLVMEGDCEAPGPGALRLDHLHNGHLCRARRAVDLRSPA